MAAITEEADGPSIGAIDAIKAASGGTGIVAAWLFLALVLAGPPASSFQTAVVSPLGSSIAQHFGGGNHGAIVAQLTITLPAIGVILGGPLTAWLIGLFGYRPVILVNAAILAVAGSAGFWVDAMVPFLASRLLVGFSAVALYSALVALTGVVFRGVTLSRMISYQNGAGAASGMVLLLLSGAVASHYGWRASFLIYLLAALFGLVAMVIWLPSKAAIASAKASASGEKASLRPLIPALLLNIVVFSVVFMVIIQGSLLMAANGITNPSVQSVVISLSTFSYALTATLCSWIEMHLLGRWTFPFALASMALGTIVLGTIPTVWGAGLGSLLIGTGSGLNASYLVRLVLQGAAPAVRERAAGLIAPCHYIGQSANPFIMQTLRVLVGIHAALVIVGIVFFIGAGWAALARLRGARA
jgi:MFS family permease